MDPAVKLAFYASGVFFLAGLLTGVWKYLCMDASEKGEAPYYVNIAHRAALLYAFAALLLMEFARYSAWVWWVDLLAVAFPLFYFAESIVIYMVHGLLRDTDNQLVKPHKLGSGEIQPRLIKGFMWSLVLAEIGGFLVLFAGVVRTLEG